MYRTSSTAEQHHARHDPEDKDIEGEEEEEASFRRGSTDREKLFSGARAAGPGGRPRARTAAEIKTAYGRKVSSG